MTAVFKFCCICGSRQKLSRHQRADHCKQCKNVRRFLSKAEKEAAEKDRAANE